MITGIDPRVDVAFVWLFGSPGHEHLLLALVNGMLEGAIPRPIVRLQLRRLFAFRHQATRRACAELAGALP